MRLLPPAAVLLAAFVGGATRAVASPASGVTELDLAFPRNQTYAPAPRLPVVFAYQNPELATALNTHVSFTIWNWDNMSNTVVTSSFDAGQANLSSGDPYLQYAYFEGFNTEGHWFLKWTVSWSSCTEASLDSVSAKDRIAHNSTTWAVHFTTKDSAPEMDLTAATDHKDCPEELGLAFDVTDTLKVPAQVDWSGSDSCAVVAAVMPTPSPCQVTIDSAAASSMAASMTASVCRSKNAFPPVGVECPPDDKSSARQLAATGMVGVAAAVGAFIFVLLV